MQMLAEETAAGGRRQEASINPRSKIAKIAGLTPISPISINIEKAEQTIRSTKSHQHQHEITRTEAFLERFRDHSCGFVDHAPSTLASTSLHLCRVTKLFSIANAASCMARLKKLLAAS
jgi:hypothetical protein